eukprot:5083476-Amphidinium_carterae.2
MKRHACCEKQCSHAGRARLRSTNVGTVAAAGCPAKEPPKQEDYRAMCRLIGNVEKHNTSKTEASMHVQNLLRDGLLD